MGRSLAVWLLLVTLIAMAGCGVFWPPDGASVAPDMQQYFRQTLFSALELPCLIRSSTTVWKNCTLSWAQGFVSSTSRLRGILTYFLKTYIYAGGPLVPHVSLLWRSLLGNVTEKLSNSLAMTQLFFSRVGVVCFAVWEAAPAPELKADTDIIKTLLAVTLFILPAMVATMTLVLALPILAQGRCQSVRAKTLHPRPVSPSPSADGNVAHATNMTRMAANLPKPVAPDSGDSAVANIPTAHPTNKQSKSARRRAAHRAAKADETKDVEAAGQWQKVQHRGKTSAKGGASKTPTTTTLLLAAKGQSASQSNQPKGLLPNTAKRQSPILVHTNTWTISARTRKTPMPAPAQQVNNKAKSNVKTWASMPKKSPTAMLAAPLAEEWPAL